MPYLIQNKYKNDNIIMKDKILKAIDKGLMNALSTDITD